MATAIVSRVRLHDGDLPHVCIKTGRPADGVVNATFSSLPSWTYLLLLAGIFPFLIALVFATEKVRAQVPIRKPVLDRYHDLGQRAWLCFGVAAACGMVAVIGVEWLWAAAVLAAIAGTLTLMLQATGWIHAQPVKDTALVELHGVSEEFANAVANERAAARAPGPARGV